MRYINVENLTFYYDREPVLENISYHVDSGEFVTLTGENGAAKSTLIKTTLGILKPKKGKIKIPWYVIGFFITCALFTLNIISPEVSYLFKAISNKLEIIALAAIGLRVNLRELIKQGKSVSLYALFVGSLQVVTAIALISIFL